MEYPEEKRWFPAISQCPSCDSKEIMPAAEAYLLECESCGIEIWEDDNGCLRTSLDNDP